MNFLESSIVDALKAELDKNLAKHSKLLHSTNKKNLLEADIYTALFNKKT